MSPGRPLAIAGILLLILSLAYMLAVIRKKGEAAIWAVWSTDRRDSDDKKEKWERVKSDFIFPKLQKKYRC